MLSWSLNEVRTKQNKTKQNKKLKGDTGKWERVYKEVNLHISFIKEINKEHTLRMVYEFMNAFMWRDKS
jgi:hypothetical protein